MEAKAQPQAEEPGEAVAGQQPWSEHPTGLITVSFFGSCQVCLSSRLEAVVPCLASRLEAVVPRPIFLTSLPARQIAFEPAVILCRQSRRGSG